MYFLSLDVISENRSALTSLPALGDYCNEVHLFPFRTEKLSSLAQMVLVIPGEYVVANFY